MAVDGFRSYLKGAPGGLYFDYNSYKQPPPVIDNTAPQPQFGLQAPMNYGMPHMPPLSSGDASSGGAGNGIGGPSGQGIGVGPSSVTGIGPTSAVSNAVNGNIGPAVMGLALGLAPAPVSMIAMAPAIAQTLGLVGLMDNIAVSNDQSTNNVANDVGAVEGAANAAGVGVASAGPVGDAAAAASPGAGAADASTGADGVGAADAGDSGSAFSRGGRTYERFKSGGRPISDANELRALSELNDLGQGYAQGGRTYDRFTECMPALGHGGRMRHPVPRAMKHLYRQFARQELA